MNKVRGIALFDALVGIVLSSIVIMAVFMVMQANFKSYFRMGETQARILEETKLRSIIQADVFHAQSMSFEGPDLTLQGNQEVIYEFRDGYTLRHKQETLDTLKVILTNKEVETDLEMESLIRKMTLHFKNDKREFSINLSKTYPAITYMQMTNEY